MIRYDPEIHHRQSVRLKGYDYGQPGGYFVTVCTQYRARLFGNVVEGRMQLNVAGKVAEECWLAIPDHFPHVKLDAFVVMPNHVHGIIWIAADPWVGTSGAKDDRADAGAKDFSPLPGTTAFRSPSKTIGSIVRGFKIGVTKWMRANTDVSEIWQPNYYDRILRDEVALHRIRRYIVENPARWFAEMEQPGRDVRPG